MGGGAQMEKIRALIGFGEVEAMKTDKSMFHFQFQPPPTLAGNINPYAPQARVLFFTE